MRVNAIYRYFEKALSLSLKTKDLQTYLYIQHCNVYKCVGEFSVLANNIARIGKGILSARERESSRKEVVVIIIVVRIYI